MDNFFFPIESFNQFAVSIVSMSTVGFVILLALPVIVQATWSDMESIMAYSRKISFRTKFVFLLGSPIMIGFLCIASVMYLLSGLLAQFYALTSSGVLLSVALFINIAVTSAALGTIGSTFVRSIRVTSLFVRSKYAEDYVVKIEDKVVKNGDKEKVSRKTVIARNIKNVNRRLKRKKTNINFFTEDSIMLLIHKNRIYNRTHEHSHTDSTNVFDTIKNIVNNMTTSINVHKIDEELNTGDSTVEKNEAGTQTKKVEA
ncbi:MAG: hypothetical protein FWD52_09800 [Candidatus Bathyarchaeota archaeon]|nr:hypothetical protein [Candidatus Termiticorpusculum sp.]